MTRLYLLLAGGIAAGLGLAILLFPVAFYSGYGIVVSGADLLNELRAPGLALALAGGFMLIGAFRPSLAQSATMLATALYLAYGLSRILGMAIDGLPGTGLLIAAATELALGLIGLAILLRSRASAA